MSGVLLPVGLPSMDTCAQGLEPMVATHSSPPPAPNLPSRSKTSSSLAALPRVFPLPPDFGNGELSSLSPSAFPAPLPGRREPGDDFPRPSTAAMGPAAGAGAGATAAGGLGGRGAAAPAVCPDADTPAGSRTA